MKWHLPWRSPSPDTAETDDTLRPAPMPVATRLNKNALIVAAVVMGMTAFVAIISMRSDPHQSTTPTPPSVPTTSVPSFLDAAPTRSASTVRADTSLTLPPNNTLPIPVPTDLPRNGAFPSPPIDSAHLASPSPSDDPQHAIVDRRIRAVQSPLLTNASFSASAPPATMPVHRDTGDVDVTAALAAWGAQMAASPSTATDVPRPASPASVPTIARDTSPYTLRAGTIIPAMLLTAANSELAGQVLAQVTRDIFDSQTQQIRLIPKGTKLLGQYDARVATGQHRLLISWTRLIEPDGRSITIPATNAVDAIGAAGITGDVDNHYGRTYGNALLLSTIAAAIQLSQPQQGNTYAPPSSRQVAAGALGQELGDVSTELIRKNLELSPTISLKAGTPLNVFLTGDLTLPPVDDRAPQAHGG